MLAEAESRVAEVPLREHRWALLALAQYQAGQQGDALRTLHRARAVLATELGLDPGPDLVALEQAILRHDPSLAPVTVASDPSTTCPYPGLVHYDVDDADLFFGRDADVAACVRRLADVGVRHGDRAVGFGEVVAGAGRDRSNPATRRRERVVVITPGAHPMDALTWSSTLGPAPVLVVDQCEEVMTLCHDSDERARFFAALVAHAEHALLVVAMRADRMGDVSSHPEFARLVERSLHLLGAMDDSELRAAIEGPAHQAGLLLEAWSRRPPRARRRARAGSAAPVVARPPQRVGAARGPDAHRRRLPRERRHTRGGRGVGGGDLRADAGRTAAHPARPPVAVGRARRRRRTGTRAGTQALARHGSGTRAARSSSSSRLGS